MRSFVAALLLFPAVAFGGEFAVDVYGFSQHIGGGGDYESTNPGLGVAYGSQHLKAVGGAFDNSFSDRTYYLGAELLSSGFVKVGAIFGAVYGYVETEYGENIGYWTESTDEGMVFHQLYEETRVKRPHFVAVPVVEIGRAFSVRLMATPEVGESPPVVAASFRVYF